MLHKLIVRCLIVLTVCACLVAPSSRAAAAAEGSDSPRTHVLFDGKDAKGWKMAGPGKFELVDGTLVSSGGMGLFWYDKEFADCIVALEYKVNNDKCNSGVFVRFPDPGNDPWVAVKQGHEIQIAGKTTGDIYDHKKNTGSEPRPAGEWNKMEIKLQGKHYTVKVNDKVVNEFDSKDRPTKGRIGIQNHDPGSIATFRNIKVEELAPAAKTEDAPPTTKKAATKPAEPLKPVAVKESTLQRGVVGEYFKGVKNFDGLAAAAATQPFLVRVDKNINFRGTDGQFDKTKLATDFGARWTGFIKIDKPGPHTFMLRTDDNAKFYLNDRLIVDNSKWDVAKDHEETIDLKPGLYALKVEFHNGPGGAMCQLHVKTPGREQARKINEENLLHAKDVLASIKWDKAGWDKIRFTRADSNAPYDKMDYGPSLATTIKIDDNNHANKGIAIKLDKELDAAVAFDTELLRYAGGWTGGFLDNHGVAFDGAHGTNPGPDGDVLFTTPQIRGADEGHASREPFSDPRKRPFGPLPREMGHYKGMYLSGDRVVLSYTVGKCEIMESPSVRKIGEQPVFVRTIRVGANEHPVSLLIAESTEDRPLRFAVSGADVKQVSPKVGSTYFVFPAKKEPATYNVAVMSREVTQADRINQILSEKVDLSSLTKGGAARWTKPVETKGELGKGDGPYVVDTLTAPEKNPYNSWLRFGGLDFFSDGRAALSTWSGDVWIVSGIDDKLEKLTWKRYATGLFQPLGLRIVNDEIYTLGRDQITRLKDLNGDGEADLYENFNNDCEVTPSFHEFSFDLQSDSEGNFYYAKAGPVRPGGRGWETLSAHNGTILKVSKDGSKLEVFATGVRAPNGMSVGPNDVVTVADNEGTWTPTCRLSIVHKGMFLGVVDLSKKDMPPTEYEKPICWLSHGETDNSSGGQVWVTSDKWGPLAGRMLHLSYGKCSLFLVDYEHTDGVIQGGVVRFPLEFQTGICRARFGPVDQQLYVAGLRGWQTTATKDAGLQRVRYTGKPLKIPTKWRVKENGVEVTFSTELDSASASDLNNYSVEQWNYLWSSEYGSAEYSVVEPKEKGHDPVEVTKVSLAPDKKTVKLTFDEIAPVMQMKIQMKLKSADGAPVEYTIYNTVNKVPGQPLDKTAEKKTASTQAAAVGHN